MVEGSNPSRPVAKPRGMRPVDLSRRCLRTRIRNASYKENKRKKVLSLGALGFGALEFLSDLFKV